jgi:putative membrane protein
MRVPWRASGLVLSVLLVQPLAAAGEPSDADFAAKAASGGRMEVELGGHAAKHAADPAVREFGERMVKDHGTAGDRLREAAAQADVPLPSALAPEHREIVGELTALRGAEFDRRYVQTMVEDHEKDVAEFRKQVEGGASPIDRWAKETLPTLEKHLSHARELARRDAAQPPADRP